MIIVHCLFQIIFKSRLKIELFNTQLSIWIKYFAWWKTLITAIKTMCDVHILYIIYIEAVALIELTDIHQ